ncbi:hypothetical protein ACFL2Y_02265, partial [Candidatus Omnitrophota bacterium]
HIGKPLALALGGSLILLCLVLAGCATNYQRRDLPDSLSEEEKAERRGQFNAFVEGLKVFMPEEKVLILAKDLMKKHVITMKREVTAAQGMQKVTWRGNFYLYANLPNDFSLTFNNNKLVTWDY